MENQLHDDKISYEQPPVWPKEMDQYYADQLRAQLELPTAAADFVIKIKRVLDNDMLTSVEKVDVVRTMLLIYDND